MPQFLDTNGRTVSADMALIGGKLRPGFREIIANGEAVHFQIPMRDAKPGNGVFLTDGAPAKSRIANGRAVIDAIRAARYEPNHPPIARAQSASRSVAPVNGRATVDALRAARWA